MSPIRQTETPSGIGQGTTATARLLNLQDKLKAGVLNKLNALTPLDEIDDRIDSDLTQGQPSLAQKIISDLFSKK